MHLGCHNNCRECSYNYECTPKDCAKRWVTVNMFILGCVMCGIMFSSVFNIAWWEGLLFGLTPLFLLLGMCVLAMP